MAQSWFVLTLASTDAGQLMVNSFNCFKPTPCFFNYREVVIEFCLYLTARSNRGGTVLQNGKKTFPLAKIKITTK